MAEAGMPQRSATEDANAGVVNPPAKRLESRSALGTSNKQLSGSDKAMDAIGTSVGSALGNALSSMVTEQTESINEQRVIDAQARQGISTAMNEVDQVKKRTGWEKAIFGENIEYRAAQQRAVQNKVQASYLEDLANIDGYAGDTPEQFHKMQTTKNAEILKEYADDPDTRSKVQAALAASGEKLASAHYKSHYAYNQLQQQETERVRIQQTFDGFNLEAGTLMTAEAKTKQMGDIKNFLSSSSKPEGMTPMAHRALILEVVKSNMKAGNAGAMLAIKAIGMDKNFSAAEQAQWDAAMDAYDTDFSQKADLIRTNADIQIAEAITPEEVDAAVATKEKDLNDLFNRSSGTQRSSLIMARGNLDVAGDDAMVRKQMKARDDAFKKAQKDAKTEADKNVINAMGIASENMKQAVANATTPEEKQAAIDAYNKQVSNFFQQLSPELANILKKEKLDTAAATAQRKLNAEQKKLREDAEKKKLELAEQKAKDDGIAEYFATNDPARKAGINSDLSLTKKEKEQGFDTHLVKGAQKFIGGDVPTVEQFGKALQSDPKLQSWVLQEMKRTGEVSPMIKTILTTATQSVDRLFDEDGNASDIGRNTVQMVDKMLQSDKGVDLIGGKDAARQWRIVSTGVKAGSGMQHVQRKLEKYDANKGKADAAGFSWKQVIGEGTRRDFANNKLTGMGIKNPTEQQLTDFLYEYQQDLVAFGYDTKEADNSAWQRVQNNKTKVFNSNIYGGGFLNEATKWTMEDFITKAEQGNYLAGKYAQMSGTSEVIRSHKQIPNLRWYTEPGEQAIFASSPSGNNIFKLTVAEMKDIEANITQQEELQKRIDESRTGIQERAEYSAVMGGITGRGF